MTGQHLILKDHLYTTGTLGEGSLLRHRSGLLLERMALLYWQVIGGLRALLHCVVFQLYMHRNSLMRELVTNLLWGNYLSPDRRLQYVQSHYSCSRYSGTDQYRFHHADKFLLHIHCELLRKNNV